MKTLFISDLDGTLLNSNAEVSENTFRIINNLIAKGIYFTVATARSERSAIPMTENININVPMILMNGTVIYSPDNIKYHSIPEKSVSEISSLYNKHHLKGTIFEMINSKLIVHENISIENKENPIYITANNNYDILLPLERDIDKLDNISHTFYEDTYTKKWFLEIFSDKATKANAVKYLRQEYNFDRIVCFGDNLNDITMFQESDLRVAVANAKPELKKLADFVTLSNDDNGVAVWLEKNYKEFLYG